MAALLGDRRLPSDRHRVTSNDTRKSDWLMIDPHSAVVLASLATASEPGTVTGRASKSVLDPSRGLTRLDESVR